MQHFDLTGDLTGGQPTLCKIYTFLKFYIHIFNKKIDYQAFVSVVFPRIFSRGGGQNFALAASPLANLFLLASLAKKVKHQGRNQDYFRGCGIKNFKNFSRRQ